MFDRAVALALALLASVAQAQAPTPWAPELTNPKPAAGDVVLPMPCGGAMAFRPVELPAANPLDDRRVVLGGADDRFGYAEYSRIDYVAGGFADPKRSDVRFYLLGKYEVTRLQFAALGERCPEVTPEGRLPQVQMTWAEAVGFAQRYSAWLVKNARDRLPAEDGAPGFVRLPTEAEWEFAARGGIAVPDSQFVAQAFPMPDGPVRYVWYQGTDSSNNELNGIGLLQPNPIGLHDILGNAAEFVLDPFRLNKLSRLHGQVGGHLLKGGDFRTPLNDIRSAARVEFAPIDRNGERRAATNGLRLAVVPPSLPSPRRLQAVRQAWGELPKTVPTPLAPKQDDPIEEVEALAKAVEDAQLKQRIESLGAVIKANVQTRNEQRDRAARSELRVGTYIATKLVDDKRVVAVRQKQIETLTGDANRALRTQIESALQRDREALDFNLSYYLDTVLRMGTEYPEAVLTDQANALKRELEARQLGQLNAHVDQFVRHVNAARGGRALERQKALDEIR